MPTRLWHSLIWWWFVRDARLELVNDTIPLELPNGRTLKLGTCLQPKQHDILTPTLINNTNLFAWSAVDLSICGP